MRKVLISFLATLAVAMVTAPSAQAQATFNQTTTSAAITATNSANMIPLASVSTIVAGHEMFVDGEAMLVLTTPASTDTVVQVRRGYDGTAVAAHASGAWIWTGTPSRFVQKDPLTGTCTPSTVPTGALPVINVRNGTLWDCAASTSGYRWSATSLTPQFETVPRTVVAGNVSSATGGYTIKITDYVVALSTTGTGSGGLAAAVTTFWLPTSVGIPGKVLVLKDESGGVGATTFVNLMGSIDGATSFQLKTAYGGVTLYAGSGGWFTVSCWAAGCR